MAWSKNGTTTLSSAGDTVTVSSLTATDFNVFLHHQLATTATNNRVTYDNNSNTDYAWRQSVNGGADGTATSQDQTNWNNGVGGSDDRLSIVYVINLDSEEKLGIGWQVAQNATGAGTAPYRREWVDKCDTSTNTGQFTRIDMNNASTGDYDTGTNVTVLNGDTTEEAILANVQSGSRFEATDTRKIYYGALPSVTYETDFSSSTGWTTTDSNDVNIANNRLEFNTPLSSTVKEIYYDLGANITSTSAWILRAKVDFTTVTASGGFGSSFFFGLTSSTSTTNTDFVGIRYRVQASPSNNAWFVTGVNGYPTDSTETAIVNPSVKTYYLEMKRTSSSNVTLTLYNNSDYTGVYQSTVTLTDAGSLGDLRYINVHVVGHPSASSDIIGNIDDLKFYNGVTSTDFTWTQEV